MKKANFLKTMTMGFTMLMVGGSVFGQDNNSLLYEFEPVPGKKLGKQTQKMIASQLKDAGIEAEYKGMMKSKQHSWWSTMNGDLALYQTSKRQPNGTTVKANIFFGTQDGRSEAADNEIAPSEVKGVMTQLENRDQNSFTEQYVGMPNGLVDKKEDMRYVENKTTLIYETDMQRKYTDRQKEVELQPTKNMNKVEIAYRATIGYMLELTANYLKDYNAAVTEVTEEKSQPYGQSHAVPSVPLKRFPNQFGSE